MAGFRIPGLPPITPAEVEEDDALVIFDRSTDETKQVPVGPALGDLLGGIVTIPPGGSFALPPGTEPAPSLIWSDDVDTGLYKPAPSEIGVSIDGVRQMSVGGAGVTIEGDLNVGGSITGGEDNFDTRYVQKVETFEMGGPAAANMWPKLSSDGRLDASLLRASVTSYKGQIHAELVPPPAALNGDFYMQAVDGTTSASWGAAANMPIKAGDFLSFSTVQGWQIVQSSVAPEAYVKRDGDTMIGKLVTVDSKPAEAGFRLLPGVAPTAPLNGDMWADGTNFWGRAGGVTRPFLTGGGTGLFADGTVGQPSISFTNDTDTGIYRPAANMLGFVTGSAEVMRIDAAGKVGIGTNNPAAPLDVAGAIRSRAVPNPIFEWYNNAGTTRYAFAYHSGVNFSIINEAAGNFTVSANNGDLNLYGGGAMLFSTGAVERMRIAVNGNVGIGTAGGVAPQGKLVVSNGGVEGFEFNPGVEAGENTLYSYNRGTEAFSKLNIGANSFAFKIGFTEVARISNGGKVGINTTTPPQHLSVEGNFALAGAQPLILWQGAGFTAATGVFASTSGGNTYDSASHLFRSLNGTTQFMGIAAGGNVGIGTAAPDAKLHIKLISGQEDDALALSTDYPGGSLVKLQPHISGQSNGGFSINIDGALPFVIAPTGQVGIGAPNVSYKLQLRANKETVIATETNSSAQGEIVGGIRAFTRVVANNWYGAYHVRVPAGAPGVDSAELQMVTTHLGSPRESMLITSDGKVGISTTTPGARLHVSNYTPAPTTPAMADALKLGEDTAHPSYHLKAGIFLDSVTGAWTGCIQNIANLLPGKLVINPLGGPVGFGITNPNSMVHIGGGQLLIDSEETIVNRGNSPYISWYHPTNARYGYMQHTGSGGSFILQNDVANGNIHFKVQGVGAVFANTGVVPLTTNSSPLGFASNAWTAVYAQNNVIQPSDQRFKTALASFTGAELAAAKTIAQGIGTFRWLDAETPDDRQHVGVIAQAVVAAMEAQGLDALAYGFVRYDEWEAVPEEIVEAVPAVIDEETGEERTPAIEAKSVAPAREAGNIYSVVYSELAMFIAAAQEQRLAEQEEVQVSLEARLAALERPRPRGPRN